MNKALREPPARDPEPTAAPFTSVAAFDLENAGSCTNTRIS